MSHRSGRRRGHACRKSFASIIRRCASTGLSGAPSRPPPHRPRRRGLKFPRLWRRLDHAQLGQITDAQADASGAGRTIEDFRRGDARSLSTRGARTDTNGNRLQLRLGAERLKEAGDPLEDRLRRGGGRGAGSAGRGRAGHVHSGSRLGRVGDGDEPPAGPDGSGCGGVSRCGAFVRRPPRPPSPRPRLPPTGFRWNLPEPAAKP